MLTLITGMPGNGKTLRAMALMFDEWERNQAGVKEGKEQPRRFFTNIAGATRDENPQAFDWIERIPPHNDWTQLPDGSFVVYDEAHSDGNTVGLERYGRLFPSTGKPGESDDSRIRAMSTHRHRGFDIVCVTQWPTKLHHQLRSLVGSHIHMTRAMGLAASGSLTWARVQTDPYDERQREKAEEEIWQYPKTLYGRYKSATLHTASHRFRLPKKVKNGLITLTALMLMAAIAWWWFDFDLSAALGGQGTAGGQAAAAAPLPSLPGRSKKSEFTELEAPPGTGQYDWVNTQPAPALAGCAASELNCRCFNTDGFQIDMTVTQCRDVISRPLPFNVLHKYASDRNRREDRTAAAQPGQGTDSSSAVIVGTMKTVQGAEPPQPFSPSW